LAGCPVSLFKRSTVAAPRRIVLQVTGSAELERALKILDPGFRQARREAKHRATYVSKHDRRRLKAVKARQRIAKHRANVSRTLTANL
jgi:predicted phage tail protein